MIRRAWRAFIRVMNEQPDDYAEYLEYMALAEALRKVSDNA